jgi:hypothetical protein
MVSSGLLRRENLKSYIVTLIVSCSYSKAQRKLQFIHSQPKMESEVVHRPQELMVSLSMALLTCADICQTIIYGIMEG